MIFEVAPYLFAAPPVVAALGAAYGIGRWYRSSDERAATQAGERELAAIMQSSRDLLADVETCDIETRAAPDLWAAATREIAARAVHLTVVSGTVIDARERFNARRAVAQGVSPFGPMGGAA